MSEKPQTFAEAFSASLSDTGTRQADVAHAAGTSRAYVSKLATGKKKASAQWVELVSDVMKLPPGRRALLHRAAARDHGFKLDPE